MAEAKKIKPHAKTRKREEEKENVLSCPLSGWATSKLGDILALNYGWSLSASKRVPGNVPVYGSNGIVDYHNEALVNSAGIIVGRKGSAGNVHYSRSPFCPIDTTFYISPSDTNVDLEFLFYLLKFVDLKRIVGDVGVPGLNREMAYLERVKYPADKREQRSIATILGQVQKAIEEQEKLLTLTAELKRTLLHQLFTQGLRNEPQKQTDIGPVPKSWEVVQFGELFQIRHGFAFLGKYFQSQGPYILLTPGHFFEEGGFRDQGEKTKYYVGNFPQSYILAKNDLLVVMTEQKSGLLGSSLMIPKGGLYLHNQRLGLIHDLDETRLLKPFLYYLLNTPALRKQISMTASGSKVRHTSPGKIRDIQVAIPPLANQEQAVAVLEALDNKRVVAIKKHANLTDLFRTLMHQLMTGQARNIQAYAHSENDNHESQMEVE
jgi:type I restriction enzyme S subunit